MREGGRDLLILLLLLLIGDKAPKPPKYVLKMGDRRKWHNKWSLCQNFWWSYWQSFYCVLVWRVQACSLYHVSYIIDQSESSHSCCYSIGTNCIDFKNKTQQRIFPKTGILDFSKKYWFKTFQDTTQMIFRTFQTKLGPVNFFHFLLIKWRFFRQRQ